MLTDKESKWLEEREQITIANGLYFCAHCDMYSGVYSVFTGYCTAFEIDDCPMVSTFRDAAEFEARVAAKLAEGPDGCQECFWGLKGWSADNAEARLKHARLAVEAEMEQEGE